MNGALRVGLALALGVAAGGCDLVFGVDSDAAPCGDESFASATPRDIVAADMFSLSWARDRMVFGVGGRMFEQVLPDGEPALIDNFVYPPASLALAPEGDAMFITAQVEPPFLQAAVRSGAASWALDAVVPTGTAAGSPSAAEFGARRVLVRLRQFQPEVQEYEADGNQWKPVGNVHALPGTHAPNLTPSGLDMVYDDVFGDAPSVFLAHRSSTDAWFGAPVTILPGAHAFPQLLGRCHTLYTIEFTPGIPEVLRRYDR